MTAAMTIPAVLHPFSPLGRVNPVRAWAAVRATGPGYRDPVTGMMLLTGYRECRAALTDPAFSAASGQRQRARDDELPPTMLTTDGLDHRRLREPVVAGWAARATERNRPLVRGLAAVAVSALPDRPPAGGLDLVSDFAEPFALAVLAGALGLPAGELAAFGRLARAASPNLDPLLRGPAAEQAAVAGRRLEDYLLAQSRRARAGGAPTDLAGLDWTAGLSGPERAALFALLVVGGFEPLVALLAATLVMLWQHPAARPRPEADLLPAVIDETLRLHSPIPFTARVCTSDITVGAVDIPAGTGVLAVICAANRDPAVFVAPDEFRLDRAAGPGHLAFGGGAHFCLGAPLIRSATAAAVTAVVERYPGMAPAGDPRWSAGTVPRRIRALPVTW